jgi:hypothetical protein
VYEGHLILMENVARLGKFPGPQFFQQPKMLKISTNADVGSIDITNDCLKSISSPSFTRHKMRRETQLRYVSLLGWVLEAIGWSHNDEQFWVESVRRARVQNN